MATPQTPQRPLPGGFYMTPAITRQSSNPISQPTIFRNIVAPTAPANQPAQNTAPQNQGALTTTSQATSSQGMSLVERAARTINNTLDDEAKYPALDNYISQGHSSDYEIPNSASWAPFQRLKNYDIPDRIFEQYNQAQVSTMMGLFADLNHAWISIDNALYLWDYTHPNPELLGFEEQPNSISAVKLVTPRPGVFVDAISRLLVVATTSDIFLVGVAIQTGAAGAKTVSLYQTRMQVSIRGLNITCIEGSPKTGRIFFAGRGDDDVYELSYQQEERWFQNRCTKINHTSKGTFPGLSAFSKTPQEFVSQLVVDDTRNLLYVLSSRSNLRVFHMRSNNTVYHCITRTMSGILSDLGHRVGPTTLLNQQTSIASISAIPAKEASRLNLVATTSSGCRIFFSAVTNSYFTNADSSSAPTSMQVHHVKFPPSSDPKAKSAAPLITNSTTPAQPSGVSDASTTLTQSRMAERFPPGFFLCLVDKAANSTSDTLFMSAPDTGRIAHPQDPSQATRFPEFGLWVTLEGRAEDIGLITPPFGATGTPLGFGNELAVQYDQPVTEIAVLTNSGIHTFRRRRLVDVFASAIRYGGADDGLEGEVRNFVRAYGRGETIATALAVACGQGSDVTVDARVARVSDPEVLGRARRTFIEHGGKAMLNENSVIDQGAPAIDNVRPSPRHEGLALYIARLLRAIWKSPIMVDASTPQAGFQLKPGVEIAKLTGVQRDLTRLQEFLEDNKTFIEGLAGPEALGRVSTKQEEVALQGEHRALTSLLTLVSDVIEGLAFVTVFFNEQVAEIVMSIPEPARSQVRQLTFEKLFCSGEGKTLAKELVKAIVNRNIAAGSNVDTVTDALRRSCGSFCSADDCVIFKAQEQLKRASDTSSSSELSRTLLNESLKLLTKVAGALSMEQLRWAVEQYISMSFFAGAVQICLKVAHEKDRGNRALSWLNDGSPGQDARIPLFEDRTRCYNLIHEVIKALDVISVQTPDMLDGQYTPTARRKREAYDEINNSQDEVFQINLYDWYLSQGWSDRLLEVRSPFVIGYLQRKSFEDVSRADLLWRYYAQWGAFVDAARVQLRLAKSSFELSLESRIEYLSRAKANANTKSLAPELSSTASGFDALQHPRQSRQELLRETSDLLDLASIQSDLLQRIKSDPRLPADSPRRMEVIKNLDGQILSINELYNDYADQASYFDLCLLIYHAADHRNAADIKSTWQNLLETVHAEAEENPQGPLPYESVAEKVRSMGVRLNLSELTFPIPTLLPTLLRYDRTANQSTIGPPHWVIDTFTLPPLSVPAETLYAPLESMFYAAEPPFTGKNRRFVASELLEVAQRWWAQSSSVSTAAGGGGGSGTGSIRGSSRAATLRSASAMAGTVGAGGAGVAVPMGSVDVALGVAQTLGVLASEGGLGAEQLEECRVLKARLERAGRR